MLGYWEEKEKTADVLDANGWMHTGDLATVDDEGYCNIVGRIKDMVTAEEVRAFCEGQIAHNKIPRYVEFVDEFPMTVTGKIQKFLMRDAVEQRLGLKAAKTA